MEVTAGALLGLLIPNNVVVKILYTIGIIALVLFIFYCLGWRGEKTGKTEELKKEQNAKKKEANIIVCILAVIIVSLPIIGIIISLFK